MLCRFFFFLIFRSIFSSKIIYIIHTYIFFFIPPHAQPPHHFRSKAFNLGEGDYKKKIVWPWSISDITQIIHAERGDKKMVRRESLCLGLSFHCSLVLMQGCCTHKPTSYSPFLESPDVATALKSFIIVTTLGCLTLLCHWPFQIERFPKENDFFLVKGKNTREA